MIHDVGESEVVKRKAELIYDKKPVVVRESSSGKYGLNESVIYVMVSDFHRKA